MNFTAFQINAPAKINLNLQITGKREDSYHLLNSLVVFTNIGDIIRFAPSKQYSLTINGTYASKLKNLNEKENIITKAIYSLCNELPPISLTLTKNLPIASGIGGGSSNAAATLLGVSKILGIKDNNIQNIALSLGADVPMCLKKKPCIASGIGEILEPIELPELYIILINPNIPISTPKIFYEYAKDPIYKKISNCPDISILNHLIEYLKNTKNDLQSIVINFYPEINTIIENINKQSGCLFARMSGSGSTCFGIFNSLESSNIAKNNLKRQYPQSWIKSATTL